MSQKIKEYAEIEKLKKPFPNHNIFNIDTVNSKYAQFGTSNNINTQELSEFFTMIASSGEDEVITLSKILLKSIMSKNLLSKEKYDFLISIFKSQP